MKRVEIDDEVYEALAGHAVGFQQPNDVLRRLLQLGEKAVPPARSAEPLSRLGKLMPLIQAQRVHPGDILVHVQPRRGKHYVAHVEADGSITTELGRYFEPSPALRDLVGSQIDGWARWTHELSGKSLRELRTEAGGRPRGA